MRNFLNKLLGGLMGKNRKTDKGPTATKGHLNNMPGHVLYGEDSGAMDEDDKDNKL